MTQKPSDWNWLSLLAKWADVVGLGLAGSLVGIALLQSWLSGHSFPQEFILDGFAGLVILALALVSMAYYGLNGWKR